ncbi:MAG: hypothetical protein ABI592_16865 [Acidobacteriota bacterium]
MPRTLADALPRAARGLGGAAFPGRSEVSRLSTRHRTRPSRSDRAAALGALCGMLAAGLAARSFPASPAKGQAIGYALSVGFDPRRDVFWLAAMAAGAVGGAWLVRWMAGRGAAAPAAGIWSNVALVVGCVPLVAAIAGRSEFREPLLALFAWSALALALRAAGIPSPARPGAAFVAAHALALWTFLAGAALGASVSLFTLAPLCLAASIAAAEALGRRSVERGAPRLGAACAALPLAFLGSRSAGAAVVGAIAVMLSPALFAALDPRDRWLPAARRFAGAVFLPAALTALAAAACLHGPLEASFFEDGHPLLPASEYLRGEIPFRDIVPGHGLLSDGLLQAAELRVFGDDYRGLARGDKLVGALFWPAVFALGCAATGSVALGFWTAVLAFLLFPQFSFLRVTASLGCLALALAASRSGKKGRWALAGAALPAAALLAIDFAVYAGAGALAALLVSRGRRSRLAAAFAAGIAGTGAGILAIFSVLGFAGPFLRATLFQIPALFSVYALGFAPPPASISGVADLPALAASLLDPEALRLWFLGGAFLAAGILISRAPACGPRGRTLLPVAVWFLIAHLSVAERQHSGYAWFVAPAGVVLTARWLKGRRAWATPAGAAAAALLGVTLVAARPFTTARAVGIAIASERSPGDAVALAGPRRAAGALFLPGDADAIRAAGEFLASGSLGPSETWLDFSNAPLLYYLYERDCPIRYYEVPFFQTAEAQREVIDTIERNPRVRAVLMATGRPSDRIDGIGNGDRAPLVADFIRRTFHPAWRRGGVEFWMRNPSA